MLGWVRGLLLGPALLYLSIYLSIYIYILWLCVEWGRALHFLGMVLKIEFVGETAV